MAYAGSFPRRASGIMLGVCKIVARWDKRKGMVSPRLKQRGMVLLCRKPGSQTLFGNRSPETPFRETEFPSRRSQTEFGNEGVRRMISTKQVLSPFHRRS